MCLSLRINCRILKYTSQKSSNNGPFLSFFEDAIPQILGSYLISYRSDYTSSDAWKSFDFNSKLILPCNYLCNRRLFKTNFYLSKKRSFTTWGMLLKCCLFAGPKPCRLGLRRHSTIVLDTTLNHLMASIHPWRFGEYGVLLHCLYSQLHSDSEW